MLTLKHGIDRVTGILKKLSSTYAKRQAEHGSAEETVETPKLTLLDKLLQDVASEHQLRLEVPAALALGGGSGH